MAYHFTRCRVQQPSEIECSDVEPSDVAPVAATSSSSFVEPSVVAVGEPESMATEPAEPVSVPIHPSPVGRPSFQRGLGVPGPARPPRVGVSLGYPSSLAGPSEMSAHSHDQLSSSSIATVVDTPPSSSLAAAPYQQNSQNRQKCLLLKEKRKPRMHLMWNCFKLKPSTLWLN